MHKLLFLSLTFIILHTNSLFAVVRDEVPKETPQKVFLDYPVFMESEGLLYTAPDIEQDGKKLTFGELYNLSKRMQSDYYKILAKYKHIAEAKKKCREELSAPSTIIYAKYEKLISPLEKRLETIEKAAENWFASQFESEDAFADEEAFIKKMEKMQAPIDKIKEQISDIEEQERAEIFASREELEKKYQVASKIEKKEWENFSYNSHGDSLENMATEKLVDEYEKEGFQSYDTRSIVNGFNRIKIELKPKIIKHLEPLFEFSNEIDMTNRQNGKIYNHYISYTPSYLEISTKNILTEKETGEWNYGVKKARVSYRGFSFFGDGLPDIFKDDKGPYFRLSAKSILTVLQKMEEMNKNEETIGNTELLIFKNTTWVWDSYSLNPKRFYYKISPRNYSHDAPIEKIEGELWVSIDLSSMILLIPQSTLNKIYQTFFTATGKMALWEKENADQATPIDKIDFMEYDKKFDKTDRNSDYKKNLPVLPEYLDALNYDSSEYSFFNSATLKKWTEY